MQGPKTKESFWKETLRSAKVRQSMSLGQGSDSEEIVRKLSLKPGRSFHFD